MIYYNCNYINCEKFPKIFKILKLGFIVKNIFFSFEVFQSIVRPVKSSLHRIYELKSQITGLRRFKAKEFRSSAVTSLVPVKDG